MTLRIALDNGDLKPMQELSGSTAFLIAMLVCAVLAAVLIIVAIVLSQPRKRKKSVPARGAHNASGDANAWKRRVAGIVESHNKQEISKDQAFAQLAQLCRDYASSKSGSDMTSHTLTEIGSLPRSSRNRQGLDMLRQTIAALYPPEFADERFNDSARQTDVEQAAQWVNRLVERWK
ncbi:hypothetical protein [Bifidobacterium tsurumiense]|uniref:Uncharacterized protein n=1 Tax=Bifidobacterium tsurumiense TaxID=356829 RepID=A0A087EFJ3_9BIFI|nr:hypothetical protein [Bifidobacterium tsurumiense]KFJ06544.1 hypothetical protein BITS_1229 [Bifidobacterium tsurumiense]MDY4677273.1 hypothetical protein [Bifidobacterium tsurumiense]